jgi:hypothetical protein
LNLKLKRKTATEHISSDTLVLVGDNINIYLKETGLYRALGLGI